MDEGGGIQGVPGDFGGHACGREFPQLVVHERKEIGGGLAITRRGGIEEAGHVGHEGRVYRKVAAGSSANELYPREAAGSWENSSESAPPQSVGRSI